MYLVFRTAWIWSKSFTIIVYTTLHRVSWTSLRPIRSSLARSAAWLLPPFFARETPRCQDPLLSTAFLPAEQLGAKTYFLNWYFYYTSLLTICILIHYFIFIFKYMSVHFGNCWWNFFNRIFKREERLFSAYSNLSNLKAFQFKVWWLDLICCKKSKIIFFIFCNFDERIILLAGYRICLYVFC